MAAFSLLDLIFYIILVKIMYMSNTLYRKYRPQVFDEIVGQNHIKITLQNEIAQNKVSHAYLFSGSRGIGKTTIARIFAKALNCDKRKDGKIEPCNKCQSCEDIKAGRSLNIIEIDAASHTGVDNVRENIIANSRVPAPKGKYKVFIIDEVHMLSISAFNALLKTLEEPPERVVFILATTEIHKVPETIISRCQRFDFKRVPLKDNVKRLQLIAKEEERIIDKEVLENIARHSEGCLRDAESLLGQVLTLEGNKITMQEASLIIPRSDIGLIFDFFSFLIYKDSGKAISLINRLVDEGVDLNNFTKELIEFLRNILIYKITQNIELISFGLSTENESKLNSLIQETDSNRLVQMIELFIEKKQELKQTSIPQLPLEMGVVEISLGVKKNLKIEESANDKIVIEEENKAPDPFKPLKEEVKKPLQAESKKYNKQNNTSNVKVDISIDQIRKKWGEFLKILSDRNHGLTSLIKMNRIIGLEGNILKIGSVYQFHIDRLSDSKHKVIIEHTLQEVYSQPLIFECVLEEMKGDVQNIKEEEKKDIESTVSNILEVFGGEVIE